MIYSNEGHHGRDRIIVGCTTTCAIMQSMPITTNVVSSKPAKGKVYSIQHYVIEFVIDLRQVGGFLLVLWFPPNKTDLHDITKILLKVALKVMLNPSIPIIKL